MRMDRQSRSKLAKETINNLIPRILKSDTQARAGIHNTQLIKYSRGQRSVQNLPGDASQSNPSSTAVSADLTEPSPSQVRPNVRVIQSDTLNAVQDILIKRPKSSTGRVAALNMASALRPGGGVLNGSLAQEESLCMRSTLYHSLDNSFYRIPEDAAIYSPDVLVFRDSQNRDLPKAEWFFTDIISCAAIRGPDTTIDEVPERRVLYANEKDKEIMVTKVRLILQIAQDRGITHLVLGAFGCGVFRNPPGEVAKMFKRAIYGDKKRAAVSGIEEIVFAVIDAGENFKAFRHVFPEGS